LETIRYLKEGNSGISEAFTGFGKTACSMPVIAAIGRKTLIVTTKEDLMMGDDQWLGSLKKFLNLKPEDIGFIRQDRCDVKGKKVVIALVHSMSKEDRYPPEIFDGFGLVIWDECHRVAADTFSNSAFLPSARLRLGLSATPDRSDGKEDVLHSHIGPVRVRSKPLTIVPRVLHLTSSWKCPRVPRKDKKTGKIKIVRLPHQPGRIMHVLKSIAADNDRNEMIAKATKLAYDKGRSIVMFTELLEHIDALRLCCKNVGIAWDDIGILKGGMAEKQRQIAVSRPLCITTYKMTSEGTNVPWWSTAVFATPRSDIVQIAGRILRVHPDKPTPAIIDVTDKDSPVLWGYAASRRGWYQQVGAEQIQL
jgi:superfamily II DNA or RNA helicase